MKKKYFISAIITAVILLIVFFIKDLFPFGNNFIFWGDMHAQIVPLYYNFYDVIYNGKSILIDFTSGTASNLLSNFSYYIASPFTLIILLFKRVDIPQAVSLIILLKFVTASFTCNYFLDTCFKKISNFYKIFFSVLYALSTYTLSLYIISGWMDIVYMLPLILIGFKKLIKEGNIKMFVTTLTISLIFNFYISIMCILFIFFLSLILFKYKKEYFKKENILYLGISVVLSLAISCIVLLPVVIQIMNSARMGANFKEVLTSKTGPIIDKMMFLTSSGAYVSCLLLSMKDYKKNKKILIYSLLALLLFFAPIIIEPVNKLLHFGSYISYPYRYGFILMMVLTIISCYFLCNIKEKQREKNKQKKYNILIITTTVICCLLIVIITYKYYDILQVSVDQLTFSKNHKSFFIAIILAGLSFISYFITLHFGKLNSKITYSCLSIILITFTLTQSLIYIKIDYDEQRLHSIYDDIEFIENNNKVDEFHYKQEKKSLISNYGMMSNTISQDYFSSLSNNNFFIINQKLGYNVPWMGTSSAGSNYFIDLLLSNKYLITENKVNDIFYNTYLSNNTNTYIYKSDYPSLGYVINNNVDVLNSQNSFEVTNKIYHSASNSNENIFEIINHFEKHNLSINNKFIQIVDKNKDSYLEKEIDVKNKKVLYIEIIKSYFNQERMDLLNAFEIYINDKKINNLYDTDPSITSYNLGIYENEKLNIKIKVNKNIKIESINIGLLDVNKTISFFETNKNDIKIKYNKNKMDINYNSKENNKILFIPTTYLNGMTATNNGKNIEIIKVFDNFIGINLEEGNNNITIKYMTPGIKLGTIISCIGIIFTLLFIKFKNKIISINKITNIAYYIYLICFGLLITIFYIIPTFIFIFSYII